MIDDTFGLNVHDFLQVVGDFTRTTDDGISRHICERIDRQGLTLLTEHFDQLWVEFTEQHMGGQKQSKILVHRKPAEPAPTSRTVDVDPNSEEIQGGDVVMTGNTPDDEPRSKVDLWLDAVAEAVGGPLCDKVGQ